MRQLNGIYTQKFNWKRHRSGHLLQGRYKAILVDKDEYLLELARYLMLNPVRAGMVDSPEELCPGAATGQPSERKTAPEFLTTDWLLARFDEKKRKAQKQFADFVKAGMKNDKSPWAELRGQIYLGDESFVESLLQHVSEDREKLREIPKKQKHASRPNLSALFEGHARSNKKERNLAIYKAHVDRGYTLQEIADFLDMHHASISRIVVKAEKEMLKCKT